MFEGIEISAFISFIGIFLLMMSILYCIRMAYDVVKVLTLKEGKVMTGKYGMLYLGLSISYIISYILC